MMEKLSARAIRRAMTYPLGVEVLEIVDSTNTEAKRRIAAGLCEPYLLLARTQTGGRGRLGRTFCSPDGAGLYMSLILHPNCPPTEILPITSAAAVAVCLAVESLTEAKPQIKWVNDIYLQDKKLCGILTEAVTDPVSGMVRSVIVGIGLNYTDSALPHEVAAIATSLFGSGEPTVSLNRLAAEVCCRLLELYEGLAQKTWLPLYRSHSWLDGKEVVYRTSGELQTGIVLGIDDEGALWVDTDQGTVALSTGEVSVRPIERAGELA